MSHRDGQIKELNHLGDNIDNHLLLLIKVKLMDLQLGSGRKPVQVSSFI